MDDKKKTPAEEKREAYLKARAEERKKISRAVRKLRKLPRHILVRRAKKVWLKKKAWTNFNCIYLNEGGKVGLGPKRVESMSSVALRHLIVTGGYPLTPILGHSM